MPLIHGKSKRAFSKNVATEMEHGKPQDQALAIAYSIKRKKKKAAGGTVDSGSPDMNMAEGGMASKNDSARTEQRPMPDKRYNDSKEVSNNSGNKPSRNDGWTDSGKTTTKQSQTGMKTTRIKHPKMVPQSGYTARLRDEEDDLQSSAGTNEGPQRQPPANDNELDAKKMGSDPDIADEHSTRKPPYKKSIENQYSEDEAESNMYAKGGEVEESDYNHPLGGKYEDDLLDLNPSEDEGHMMADSHNEEDPMGHNAGPDMEGPHNKYQRRAYAQGGEISIHHDMDDVPQDEEDIMHEASLASAIMADRNRRANQHSDSDIDEEMYMAEGGRIHSHGSMDSDYSDQADLSRNADEDANEEDQASFDSLRKENYSESEGLRQLDNPMDSGMTDDPREDEEENDHDRSIVGQIRKKMRVKSPITR